MAAEDGCEMKSASSRVLSSHEKPIPGKIGDRSDARTVDDRFFASGEMLFPRVGIDRVPTHDLPARVSKDSMTKNKPAEATTADAAAPAAPLTYETFLEKFGAKDRLNVEKHLTALSTENQPARVKLWKQLAIHLMQLAGHSGKLNGQQGAQFFAADGKYRMQVFALQDERAGDLKIYMADIIDNAIKAGLIKAPKKGEAPNLYHLPDGEETLTIDRLDGNAPDNAAFFKDMLSWNRKAIRIGLPPEASKAKIKAVEAACALAVKPKA
jgi:hypothetical protein